MSLRLIEERLRSYNTKSAREEEHALREITQECVLAALGRTNFFSQGVFQGGTALRILYGLNRFSEDLDFVLNANNNDFTWEPYLIQISKELEAFGFNIEIQDRSKLDTAIKKAFIKDDSLGKLMHLQFSGSTGSKKIKIKLEVDTNPPKGSIDERKILDFPYISSIMCQTLPSLFAGKIHALLCRDYIKGRDWYDFLWYTARGTPINYGLLQNALYQYGPWQGNDLQINRAWCIEELSAKIKKIDWSFAAQDVQRFLKPIELASLSLWDDFLFLEQLNKIPNIL